MSPFAPEPSALRNKSSRCVPIDVEVLLVGEVPEWETVEYVRDASAQGRHKALILLGHEVSEEPGMKKCPKIFALLFPETAVVLHPRRPASIGRRTIRRIQAPTDSNRQFKFPAAVVPCSPKILLFLTRPRGAHAL